MATKGGARIGAGRKSKADEERVRTLAVEAIVKKYGSEQAGFSALLDSEDTGLIKWVYEHAYGKPKEKMDMKLEGGVSITFRKANAD